MKKTHLLVCLTVSVLLAGCKPITSVPPSIQSFFVRPTPDVTIDKLPSYAVDIHVKDVGRFVPWPGIGYGLSEPLEVDIDVSNNSASVLHNPSITAHIGDFGALLQPPLVPNGAATATDSGLYVYSIPDVKPHSFQEFKVGLVAPDRAVEATVSADLSATDDSGNTISLTSTVYDVSMFDATIKQIQTPITSQE